MDPVFWMHAASMVHLVCSGWNAKLITMNSLHFNNWWHVIKDHKLHCAPVTFVHDFRENCVLAQCFEFFQFSGFMKCMGWNKHILKMVYLLPVPFDSIVAYPPATALSLPGLRNPISFPSFRGFWQMVHSVIRADGTLEYSMDMKSLSCWLVTSTCSSSSQVLIITQVSDESRFPCTCKQCKCWRVASEMDTEMIAPVQTLLQQNEKWDSSNESLSSSYIITIIIVIIILITP